jgi:hypothetical protein
VQPSLQTTKSIIQPYKNLAQAFVKFFLEIAQTQPSLRDVHPLASWDVCDSILKSSLCTVRVFKNSPSAIPLSPHLHLLWIYLEQRTPHLSTHTVRLSQGSRPVLHLLLRAGKLLVAGHVVDIRHNLGELFAGDALKVLLRIYTIYTIYRGPLRQDHDLEQKRPRNN